MRGLAQIYRMNARERGGIPYHKKVVFRYQKGGITFQGLSALCGYIEGAVVKFSQTDQNVTCPQCRDQLKKTI